MNRDRIIRVIGLTRPYKRVGKSFLLPPLPDMQRGGTPMTGLELLEPEVVKNLDPMVKERALEGFVINDGMNLDLRNDYDFLVYLRCLLYGNEIATSFSKRSSGTIFILHDEVEEAEKDTLDARVKLDAMKYVASQSDQGLKDIAIYLGHDVSRLKPIMIEGLVSKIALSEPEKINKFKNMVNKDSMMFIYRLASYRIIHRTKDGYMYKDNFLGTSIEGVLSRLSQSDNNHMMIRLGNELEAFENPSSDTRKDLAKEKINEEIGKEKEKTNDLIKVKDLQIEYMELTGKKYEGPKTLKDLELAVQLEKEELEKGKKLSDDLGLDLTDDSKANDFMEKMKDKDVSAIKKSLVMRGVEKSLFEDVEDKEELLKIGIDNLK
jgi:hypothetical protein